MPYAICYESAIRHPCRAGDPAGGDEDIPSQGQDTRLVTESVVRDPLLLVRLQKRLRRHVDSSVDLYSTCAIHGYGRSKELI